MKLKITCLFLLFLSNITFSIGLERNSVAYKLVFLKLNKNKYQKIKAKVEVGEDKNDLEINYNPNILKLINKNLNFYIDAVEQDQRDKTVYPFIFTGKLGKEISYKEIIENKSYDIEEFIKVTIKSNEEFNYINDDISTNIHFHLKKSRHEFESNQTVDLSSEYKPIAVVNTRFESIRKSTNYYLVMAKLDRNNTELNQDNLLFEDEFDKFEYLEQDKRSYYKKDVVSLYYMTESNYDIYFKKYFKKIQFYGEILDLNSKISQKYLKLSTSREDYLNFALKYSFDEKKISIGLVDELNFDKIILSTELYINNGNEDKKKEYEIECLFNFKYKFNSFDFLYELEFLEKRSDEVYITLFPEKKYNISLKMRKNSEEEKYGVGFKIKY